MTARALTSLSSPTLVGLGAIGFWSTLAVFTAMTGKVPPFLTVAITFAMGGALILGIAAARGTLAQSRPTLASFCLGLYGMFGDTAIYFAALKLAPPAEANLIHYLWPLLIVIFATFLPGGKLSLKHLGGALLGLVAVLLLIGGKLGAGAGGTAIFGYILAACGAFVWASYSVLSRLVASVPTESLGVTILAAAILALGCHFAFETTMMPQGLTEWAGMIGLGAGSMGLAFVCWDIGMKRGDVAFLGVASYAAPVLSTIILVLAGYSAWSWQLGAACALIVAGAVIARKA
ncbi:MAG: EamA family transporter [Rhizobiales bacterium PAR1]|nr:MAG: EamA family transporter [Rhizobiales bacterium PAR1]